MSEDGLIQVADEDEHVAKRVKLDHEGGDVPPTPLSAQLPEHLSPLHPRTSHVPRWSLLFELKGHTKGVTAVRFSPDGRHLVSAGADGQLLCYDVVEGTFLRALKSHTGGINDVAWSPDGKTLASCSDDKTVRIWAAESGDLLKIMRGHTSHVFCVTWAPQGNVIFTGSFDETIKVWDAKRGTCMRSIPAHSDPITAVQCNRDGSMIASCSFDGLIRMWDAATGQCLKTLVGETNPPVTSVRFSPNGRYLLAATLDSTVRLWDFALEKAVKEYSGHTGIKYCSPPEFFLQAGGGTYIASGSEDGKLVLWDVQAGQSVYSEKLHNDAIISVAYNSARAMLATGALERDSSRVKVWVDTTRV